MVHDKIRFFEQQSRSQLQGDQRIQAGRARTAASRSQLPTRALRAASFDTTTNDLLQTIWAEVIEYNRTWAHATTLSEGQKYERMVRLDAIFYWSVQYLMSKWAKDAATEADSKRVKRWAALKDLLDAITSELEAMGMRRIVGTTNFREISATKRNYWLERLDPKHRPGWVLSKVYEKWMTAKPAQGGRPVPFIDWLETPAGQIELSSDPASGMSVRGYGQGEPLFKKTVHLAGDGKLKRPSDKVFTTRGRRTEFSGNGWAIFVCSTRIAGPNGLPGHFVFSYTHAAGDFHHSTFLGGAPVLAAGEWVVDEGKVRVITAKSGHYMPTPDNLLEFVRACPWIPGNAIIRPDLLDRTKGDKTIRFYTVADFRSSFIGATPLKRARVLAAIPAFSNRDMNETHNPPKKMVDFLPV